MTTTFTWAINNLEHYVTDGIVYLVYYSVVADDGTCTNSIYNSTRLEQPEGDIIPYTDLTPEVVIGWLQDKLDVPAIEASLQAQLDEQATPTKAVGLPWSNAVSDSVILPPPLTVKSKGGSEVLKRGHHFIMIPATLHTTQR